MRERDVADEGRLADDLECGAGEPEKLLLALHRRTLPELRALVDPRRKEPDQHLPHPLLVLEGDLGPRGQAEAEHALSRAAEAWEVVRVLVDLVALHDAVVLLLEDAERVLERVVDRQLLVDALVAAQGLVQGEDVRAREVGGDLVQLDVVGEGGEDVCGHVHRKRRVLLGEGGYQKNSEGSYSILFTTLSAHRRKPL